MKIGFEGVGKEKMFTLICFRLLLEKSKPPPLKKSPETAGDEEEDSEESAHSRREEERKIIRVFSLLSLQTRSLLRLGCRRPVVGVEEGEGTKKEEK